MNFTQTSTKNGILNKIFPLLFISLTGLFLLSSCKKSDEPSKLTGLLSFNIKGMNVNFTIDQTALTVSNEDSLPYQTDVSDLVAEFESVPHSTVSIGDTPQQSGVTANDFSSPVTYTVVAEDGHTTKNYKVTVNVAQTDPNAVSWNQVTPDGGWGSFTTIQAGYFDSKFWIFGESLGFMNAFDFGLFSSSDGITWSRQNVRDNLEDSVPHVQHTMLVTGFNNKMWLLGGHAPGIGMNFDFVTNEVWSSADGTNWTGDTTTLKPRWSPRERINAVVFDGKLWVIGGNGYPAFGTSLGVPYNDVWSSSDGSNWTEVTTSPGFTARTLPSVFVYKGKIWVTGGMDNNKKYLNDVWNSSDGVTWTKVNVTGPFTARSGHKTVEYHNELFMIGGENADGVLSDMWVSDDDGITWKKIEKSDQRALPANFKARTDFSLFVQDNSIWIIGGRGTKSGFDKYVPLTDVWKGTLVKTD